MVIDIYQHIVYAFCVVTLTESLKYLCFHELPREILILYFFHLLEILLLVKKVLKNLELVRLCGFEILLLRDKPQEIVKNHEKNISDVG